jgi:hypothetical protein
MEVYVGADELDGVDVAVNSTDPPISVSVLCENVLKLNS